MFICPLKKYIIRLSSNNHVTEGPKKRIDSSKFGLKCTGPSRFNLKNSVVVFFYLKLELLPFLSDHPVNHKVM